MNRADNLRQDGSFRLRVDSQTHTIRQCWSPPFVGLSSLPRGLVEKGEETTYLGEVIYDGQHDGDTFGGWDIGNKVNSYVGPGMKRNEQGL